MLQTFFSVDGVFTIFFSLFRNENVLAIGITYKIAVNHLDLSQVDYIGTVKWKCLLVLIFTLDTGWQNLW